MLVIDPQHHWLWEISVYVVWGIALLKIVLIEAEDIRRRWKNLQRK